MRRILYTLSVLAAGVASAFAQTNPGITRQGAIAANDCVAWASNNQIKSTGAACATAVAAITGLTGDGTASGPGNVPFTLANVNANVGAFGSATQSVQFTVNAKGLITAAANVTVTPALASITGLGTNWPATLAAGLGTNWQGAFAATLPAAVATWLATPSCTNFAAAVTGETGTGACVMADSPALTGVPTAPTAGVGTNTTQLATTAFVIANAGSGSVANPTATIGLTAVNGSATSAIRSDGAPALSQAIIPTWTQLHTFSANLISPVIIGGTGATAELLLRPSTSGAPTADRLRIRSGLGLNYTPDMYTGTLGNPWQNLTGTLNVNSYGQYFWTFGTPNLTDALFNCGNPTSVPNQPGTTSTVLNYCATLDVNAVNPTDYTNVLSGTCYVIGTNLDVNCAQFTVVATVNGTGGAGLIGVGRTTAAAGIAHGIELAVECHAPAANCSATTALLFALGGGNGGLANLQYVSFRSGAAANSAIYGIRLGDGPVINPFQNTGSSFITSAGTHVRFDYGIDFRNATVNTCAFASTNFCVDGSGNVTANSLSGPGAITVGTTVVAGGTSGYMLFNQAGVLGNCTVCSLGTLTLTGGLDTAYWQNGSSTTQVGEWRITSGNATSFTSYGKITGGNNGATVLMQFALSGGNYAGAWIRNAAPSATNYWLLSDVTGSDKNTYYNTLTAGGHVFQVNAVQVATIAASGSFQMIKTNTSTGLTITVTAPGALNVGLFAGCGTVAGTAALYAGAGTSTTASRILDNIGSGVTGC